MVGVCMAGGHVWWGVCMVGGHACHTCPPDTTRYGRSMRGRYASYWNAFLFIHIFQENLIFKFSDMN